MVRDPSSDAPGLHWEISLSELREVSERRAWRIAIFALVIALLAVGTLLVLLPLKQAVPYLIRVDRLTGENDLVARAAAQPVPADALQSKYWIAQYVRTRERYDPDWLQLDYQAVHRWSSKAVATAYEGRFQGDAAIQRVLSAGGVERISVLSIGLVDAHHAVVRIERTRTSDQGAAPHTSRATANLVFEFHPALIGKERDLIENPLGFQVTAYRLDPELVEIPAP